MGLSSREPCELSPCTPSWSSLFSGATTRRCVDASSRSWFAAARRGDWSTLALLLATHDAQSPGQITPRRR
eukprot:12904565-Prorocentrum_lima.AAC.1